ncbi:dehydratase [Photobacterium aquae]|uniref:Dehydratase n=1 Tax=Photobacterium aquae TaxID=1195763 RepID=A0A0J1H0X1_9GAMM|nr:MaoC family dehydratase [Photobacterium aquae]KLV05439.1 dehydratase [Photobacterium aquae]
MKVVDFIKQRREEFSRHSFDLKELLSPSLREHWLDFVTKTNKSKIVQLAGSHATASNDDAVVQTSETTSHLAAINKEKQVNTAEIQNTPVQTPAAVAAMKPEAEVLYQELTDTLGQIIHTGDWLLVDQGRINQFADVTEDHQWIHTDPNRAAEESPFKTTVAHGFLTLSLLSVLTDSVDPSKQKFPTAKMTVNMGFNKIRFPYPVKSGNRIRATTSILAVTPVKRGLEIVQELRVEIEGVRRPGCVAESVIQLHF